MIFAGILLNRSDYRELRAKMDGQRDELRRDQDGLRDDLSKGLDGLRAELGGKVDSLRDDLRQFDRTIGQHDARMDNHDLRLTSLESKKPPSGPAPAANPQR